MTSEIRFDSEISGDGETPMFNIRGNDNYRRGHYGMQFSYFRRRVYIHLQDNNRGKQVSLPEDVLMAILNMSEELKAAIDLTRNLSAPPSPPLNRLPPLKRAKAAARRVILKDNDTDEDEILTI